MEDVNTGQDRDLASRGFSLVELGDLDGAEKAFSESLDLEPGNSLAIRELKYIQHLRIQQRKY